MKLIWCILAAFLLAACSANVDIQTSPSIPSPESSVISDAQTSRAASEVPEPSSDSIQESLNQPAFVIMPADIKSVKVDDFYSIHPLSQDRILILAGDSSTDQSYLVSYDLKSFSDHAISEFSDAISHVDFIDETSYCVSTATDLYWIKDNKLVDQVSLPYEKTFDYRYDPITGLLCYVDDDSRLVLEDTKSKERQIICEPTRSVIENGRYSPEDGPQVSDRGANPLFWGNPTQIAFITIGMEDFSSLRLYDVRTQSTKEYPVSIYVHSYEKQPFGSDLIITSHQDDATRIYQLSHDQIKHHDLDLVYHLTCLSPYDLLVRGVDESLYRIDLGDFSSQRLFSPEGDEILSNATSTENYIVLLKTGGNEGGIELLPKESILS